MYPEHIPDPVRQGYGPAMGTAITKTVERPHNNLLLMLLGLEDTGKSKKLLLPKLNGATLEISDRLKG